MLAQNCAAYFYDIVGTCALAQLTCLDRSICFLKGTAIAFGLKEFTIGATVVAVGTSVPELATTIIAKLRGHEEIGLGTILGSNIFNGLLIIGVAAIICPITVGWREVAGVLIVGLVAVALTFPNGRGFIERRRGALLLMLYAAYLVTILQRQP